MPCICHPQIPSLRELPRKQLNGSFSCFLNGSRSLFSGRVKKLGQIAEVCAWVPRELLSTHADSVRRQLTIS